VTQLSLVGKLAEVAEWDEEADSLPRQPAPSRIPHNEQKAILEHRQSPWNLSVVTGGS